MKQRTNLKSSTDQNLTQIYWSRLRPRSLAALTPRLLYVLSCLTLGAATASPYSATTGQAEFDYKVTIIGVHGSTSAVRAALNINPDDLAATSGSVTVTVATLKTGHDTRDQHMAGALDSKRYNDAVFTLSQVEGLSKLPEGQQVSGTVTGQFSLKGVDKLLSAPVKLKRVGQLIEVATQFKFNPYDYGVSYFGGAKSIVINVKFKLAGN